MVPRPTSLILLSGQTFRRRKRLWATENSANASGARGEIVFYNTGTSTVFVKMRNENVFKAGEELFLSCFSLETGANLEDRNSDGDIITL